MNVTVIHGTMHKGSTYHCVHLLLEKLAESQPLSLSEFFLPRDMPHFCSSCFSCFLKGEQTCPHYDSVKPIADALDAADMIILDSPSYVCDVSGQMKALLDHLGYQWLPHRPKAGMFHKIGLVVTTAAGAGTSKTAKTMKNSLTYWGVSRIYTMKNNVGAMNWEDVKPKKKEAISGQADLLCKKIRASFKKAGRIKPSLFIRLAFTALKGMQKGNNWNPTDRDYWVRQGWLDGKKPW